MVLAMEEKKVEKSPHACEYSDRCKEVSPQCLQYFQSRSMLTVPKRRWMYCSAYKIAHGMSFDKELGLWIMPKWKQDMKMLELFARQGVKP